MGVSYYIVVTGPKDGAPESSGFSGYKRMRAEGNAENDETSIPLPPGPAEHADGAVVSVKPCTSPGVHPKHANGLELGRVVSFNSLDQTYTVVPISEYKHKRKGIPAAVVFETSLGVLRCFTTGVTT